MKVTYLNHSGFLLEWEHCYWIFDYYKGELPKLDSEKDIFVFSSHSHHDHFNPEILSLFARYPLTTYIFSDEIKDNHNPWDEKTQKIHFLKNHADYYFSTSSGETIQVHTLQSTDCGCAFFIKYNEKTIYHAGDLHWWYWEGEDPDWNRQMTSDYKKEMEFLNGQVIDLGFTPLDPRQEKDYALGMNYLLENTHTRHIFPMHFWDDFSIIEKYLNEYSIPDRTVFHVLQENGQSFEIML